MTARPALCTISCSVPSGQSQPQKNPRPTRARTSTVPARTRLEVCTWATVRPVVHTVQAPSIPPNGHHASADSPPDVTWPTACQPTTAITTAWIACRAQRVFAPQAAARRGTRTRTSVVLGLRSVRSSCMVIDVSSWWAGRQASPGLCITASGWSASQEDRWIADGEGMEAELRLVGDRRRSRSPDVSSRRLPPGSLPIADSPAVGQGE